MSGKLVTKSTKGMTLSAETLKTIVNLYQTSKITQRDLAKNHGISKSSLNRLLKANKVAIRKEEKPSKIIFFDL